MVGFPVVIFDQSRLGMSDADRVVPAVTRPYVSTVNFVYVPGDTTPDLRLNVLPVLTIVTASPVTTPALENCTHDTGSVPIVIVLSEDKTHPVSALTEPFSTNTNTEPSKSDASSKSEARVVYVLWLY